MTIDSKILLKRRIWAIVEDACMAAQDDLKPTSHEAINWGDLDCAEVGTKNDGYYTIVEEAAPSAVELAQYVRAHLAENGLTNVEVTTEW